MRIEEIDGNFITEGRINREGLRFLSVLNAPFSVHGLTYTENGWIRMPLDVAKTVNEGVYNLARNTAGGRVRFRTDSPYIAIRTVQPIAGTMAHMPLSGHVGFDMYVGDSGDIKYFRSFIPPVSVKEEKGYESVIDVVGAVNGLQTVTLNFPLYHPVNELYIGLKEGSLIECAPEYSVKTPIIFYGSSITQGGCASRPGCSYQALLSRMFDADYINLGFSGSARGEESMAEYLASLDMSAFVYDYDHNSPSCDTLRATHEKMLRIVRRAHPKIPIIAASRPKVCLTEDEIARKKLISDNVDALRRDGDKNISFVPGDELMSLCGVEGTVDGTHPTDLGFYSMAIRFASELEKFGFIRKQ